MTTTKHPSEDSAGEEEPSLANCLTCKFMEKEFMKTTSENLRLKAQVHTLKAALKLEKQEVKKAKGNMKSL